MALQIQHVNKSKLLSGSHPLKRAVTMANSSGKHCTNNQQINTERGDNLMDFREDQPDTARKGFDGSYQQNSPYLGQQVNQTSDTNHHHFKYGAKGEG